MEPLGMEGLACNKLYRRISQMNGSHGMRHI
jgi:hypothetical protein